jgi:hypothetical protein
LGQCGHGVHFDLGLSRCCRACTKARSTLFMRVW